jgi:predicted ATPase
MAVRLAKVLHLPADEGDTFVRLARAPLAPPQSGGLSLATLDVADASAQVSPRRQVALPPDALIGRAADLQRLRQALLVDGRRLVTLLGPGGIGKTRLALQVAADLAKHFDDGVAIVALAPLTDAADVITAIAEAVGFPLPNAQTHERALLAFLRERSLLLVLDNLEHLLGPEQDQPISAFLTSVLREAPKVTVLCTSRERLRLRTEAIIELDGLSLPVGEQPGVVERAESTLLFLERARQVVDTFTLTSDNRVAIANICRLLGGAPLGIELAAAWVRVMSCVEIAAEMARSIDFLALDDRDLAPRHRSMRAVIDHSWQLLTTDEQRVLLRLSVFRGGFRREAVEAVCADEINQAVIGLSGGGRPHPATLLPILSGLVDKSLLRRASDDDGATRYDLHEVMRQYLAARLAEEPTVQATTERQHAIYYAEWLIAQDRVLKSAGQRDALRAITVEIGNVRTTWRWAVQQRDAQMLRRLVETFHWFYEVRGWYSEGMAMFGAGAEALRPLAEQGDSASDNIRAAYWLLVNLEGWHAVRSNPVVGLPRLHAGLEGQRHSGDSSALALCLVTMAYVQVFVGDYPNAQALLDEAEVVASAAGSTWLLSVGRVVRGVLETLRSDPQTAQRYLQEALVTARAVGDPRHITLTLNYLGLAALSLGHVDAAERVCQEGLAIAQQHQDSFQTSLALQVLGRVALARSAYHECEALLERGLVIAREMGDHWLEAQALGYLAQLAVARGDDTSARVHQRAAVHTAAAAPQPIALDELAALAELELERQPDAALTALAYVRQHPLSREPARRRAQQHWCDIGRQFPDDRCQAAEAVAHSFPQNQPAALLTLFGPVPSPERAV